MRLNIATPFIAAAAVAPALTHGFRASGPAATRTSTSLAARRSMLPMLRRSDLFFPDNDRLFGEMDEMMESSLVAGFSRPSSSLLGRDTLGGLKLRRPLGFEVVQDKKEYKMAVKVPGVEAKNINLQVDQDGRVLRLKGNRTYEDGGMKVQSRFEKTILLSPDVDTTKLAANILGDVLTVVAPKIEKKHVLDKAEDKKIEIKVEGPEAALQDAPKIEKKDVLDKTEDRKIEIKVEGPEAALQDAPNIEKKDVLDKAKDRKIAIEVEGPKAALQDASKIEKKEVMNKAEDRKIEIKVEGPAAALQDASKIKKTEVLDKAEGRKIEIKVQGTEAALQDAPEIEEKDLLDKAEGKKIEIKVQEPEAALQDDGEPSGNTQSKAEKRWPVRDFPY